MRTKNTTSEKKCVHHWLINSENVGRCKKCPEVKDFGAMHTKASDAMERKVQTISAVLIRRADY